MHPIAPISLEIAVLILGVIMLLAESFSKDEDKGWIARTSIFVIGWLFLFSFFTSGNPAEIPANSYWNFYSADPTAMFFKRIALLTTVVVLVMSLEYKDVLKRYIPGSALGAGTGEFYTLPIFTCAGLMFMASAIDFTLIFVSLELVTISFYVLVAYTRRKPETLEAGVKYLILGALSTGFLVYGITWIFGVTGETKLSRIAEAIPHLPAGDHALLFGILLVMIGLGFKVAAAPFQLWVPDVYQGAPTPITAFLSVGSKAAGFIVLMRVVQTFLGVPEVAGKVVAMLAILAALSVVYGNLAALPQDNLKRLLAYSSIGHAGYLLIAVASVSTKTSGFGSANVAITFYLAGYLLMTLLSFLVLIVVSRHSRGEDIEHFNGLGKRSPGLALGMLVAMLSLAGIPFTAGFYGKFLVFGAAVQQGHYFLVGLGIITVGAGFYYYLRVVSAMYWQEPTDATPIKVSPLTSLTIFALAAAIIFFGIFPSPIIDMLRGESSAVATTAQVEAVVR